MKLADRIHADPQSLPNPSESSRGPQMDRRGLVHLWVDSREVSADCTVLP